jgi:hypothetical protein
VIYAEHFKEIFWKGGLGAAFFCWISERFDGIALSKKGWRFVVTNLFDLNRLTTVVASI